jgi:hypothetical protein
MTPAPPKAQKQSKLAASQPPAPYYPAQNEPIDLPHIIAKGVSTSVETAVAAVAPTVQLASNNENLSNDRDFIAVAPSGASVRTANGVTVSRAPNGATVTVYPPDANGRRKVVAIAENGATAISYADSDGNVSRDHRHRSNDAIDNAIAMKTVGVTPEYVAEMRAAAPELRDAEATDLIGMKAVGVTPDYVRGLYAAGIRNFDADDLAGARAIGVDGNYVRDMRAAGFGNADLDDLTGARAVGVTGAYVREMRARGYDGDLDDFIALRSVGHVRSPTPPPAPPPPPRLFHR